MNEVLRNPENYRIGPNYRASNIVFPVMYKGERCIIKRPRISGDLTYLYYYLRDDNGNRILSSSKEGMNEEARKLKILNGKYAPKLIDYDPNTAVECREYIDGEDFRKLKRYNDKKSAIELAALGIREIHSRDIILGDATIKNVILTKDKNKALWIDFDGVFDEENINEAKARDIIKFINTTYQLTIDETLKQHAVDSISELYKNKKVMDFVRLFI